MRLKIRRLDPTIPLPSYGTDEAAGFDLAAAADVAVAPGRVALVGTGLVIEVPTGHFLGIFARNSTPLKRGLLGTVRQSGPSSQRWLVGSRSDPTSGSASSIPIYSGPNDEIMVQVLNFTDAEVHVQRGDRLPHGVVLASPRVSWQEVPEIRPVTRGGFGATDE